VLEVRCDGRDRLRAGYGQASWLRPSLSDPHWTSYSIQKLNQPSSGPRAAERLTDGYHSTPNQLIRSTLPLIVRHLLLACLLPYCVNGPRKQTRPVSKQTRPVSHATNHESKLYRYET
jgi:hypothetical protein